MCPMRLPRQAYQMQQVIETHLPHLSRFQLARLSCGWCGAIGAVNACQNTVETGWPYALLRHRVEIPWFLRSSRKGKSRDHAE